jgi:hypothetical protein
MEWLLEQVLIKKWELSNLTKLKMMQRVNVFKKATILEVSSIVNSLPN